MTQRFTRRLRLPAAAPLTLLAGCGGGPANDAHPPIVFVQGNGDTAALSQTTLWRFESSGWRRQRLHATTSKTAFEFVLSASGLDITHLYRSPFARPLSPSPLRA